MRREAGRAFLWLAVVLGAVLSVFGAVAGFWMLVAPFFETHRSLVTLGLAGILLLATSAWMGAGAVTLAEILRETRRPTPMPRRRSLGPEAEERR